MNNELNTVYIWDEKGVTYYRYPYDESLHISSSSLKWWLYNEVPHFIKQGYHVEMTDYMCRPYFSTLYPESSLVQFHHLPEYRLPIEKD